MLSVIMNVSEEKTGKVREIGPDVVGVMGCHFT